MTDLLPARPRPMVRRPASTWPAPNRWTGAVYKLLGALTAPVAGTLMSALDGPAWLTWLSLSVSLLLIAACFVVLFLERRTYQRAARQHPRYARSL
jgi:hypothetical protein